MKTVYEAINPTTGRRMRILWLRGVMLLRQEHNGIRWQTTERHTLTEHQARTLSAAAVDDDVKGWLDDCGSDLY